MRRRSTDIAKTPRVRRSEQYPGRKMRFAAPNSYFIAALTAACGNQRDKRDLSLSRQ
jgi:hypothetical protein